MNCALKQIRPKKRSNSKTKMADYQKRARNGLKGFTLKWIDSDPFSENGNITDTDVTHKNPTQKLICRDMWYRCQEWITQSEFTWNVIMVVVYDTETRGEKRDELEFNFTCSLRGKKSDILNDAMELELKESIKANESFPDGHKNKGVYRNCEFTAIIVGV